MTEITPEEFGVATDRGASTLSRLVALKGTRKAIDEEIAGIEQALRIELGNDPTPIVDGEHGISAVLKERNKPASIDLVTLAKKPEHAEHIVEAARAGLLNVALTPLRALKGKSPWADALLGAEMPNGITYVLEVNEK